MSFVSTIWWIVRLNSQLTSITMSRSSCGRPRSVGEDISFEVVEAKLSSGCVVYCKTEGTIASDYYSYSEANEWQRYKSPYRLFHFQTSHNCLNGMLSKLYAALVGGKSTDCNYTSAQYVGSVPHAAGTSLPIT